MSPASFGEELMERKSKTLRVAILPVIAVGLVAGIGFAGNKIWNRIQQDIYNHPRGKVTGETPRTYELEYQEVNFNTGNDIELKGWYVPGKKDDECIILAPGKGGNRWNVLTYAPFLVESGFNVLLFDPRSTGLSGGNRYGFGYFESQDLQYAVNFLAEEKKVSEFGVLGHSAGATAGLLAGLEDQRIDAVVADSPYANLRLASKDFGGYSRNPFLQTFFPIYMFSARLALGVDIYGKTNALERIKKMETASYFIHGKADEAVGHQNSVKLYERKPSEKQLWLVPETGHVQAYKNYPEEYAQKVAGFFSSNL